MSTCTDCNRTAIVDVLVPWIRIDGDVGADWTPLCRVCYPTGEQWDTLLRPDQRNLSNAQWMMRVAGHNGIPCEEQAADIMLQD